MDFQRIAGPEPDRIGGWRSNNLRFMRDRVGYLMAIYEQYGAIATFARNNPERWLFAFGADYNHQILANPALFEHFMPWRFAPTTPAHILTHGLLALNGQAHHERRSALMKLFAKERLHDHVLAMAEVATATIRSWRRGQILDLSGAFKHLTLAVLGRTIFAIGLDHQLAKAIKGWLGQLVSAQLLLLPGVMVPFSPLWRFNRRSALLIAEIEALIAQRRQAGSAGSDALNVLLGLQTAGLLSADAVISEAMTLLIAGYETTAVALTWTCLLLSQSPAVLAAVVDELQAVLRGAPPTYADLERLPLLDRVIKETLRLFPPIPYQHRRATAPFELGGYALPSGAIVSYSPYVTQRMDALYAEPATFLPQRWEGLQPPPYAYLPFGAGPRMCLGALFALTEIKVILAILLQQHGLMLASNAVINRQTKVVLEPQGAVPMHLTEPGLTRVVKVRKGDVWTMVRC